MSQEAPGCLGLILGLFGVRLKASPATETAETAGTAETEKSRRPIAADLPFRQRDDFLSRAEFSFVRVLFQVVGTRGVVCPKVNLGDLFFVPKGKDRGLRNRIDRKHVDFLICDPATMRPLFAIELDDSSHSRPKAQESDRLKDQVFQSAGLPLVRVVVQASYNPQQLWQQLERYLTSGADDTPVPPPAPPAARPPAQASGPPTCPKCGVAMVQRTAKKGKHAGQLFYGCPNYPKCRETVSLS